MFKKITRGRVHSLRTRGILWDIQIILRTSIFKFLFEYICLEYGLCLIV